MPPDTPPAPASAPPRPRKRQGFWTVFRWCRIALLLGVLLLLLGLVYLNQVGLPGFLRTRLQTELHQRGADFQFERLRWRWYEGLVAESISLGAAQDPLGLRLRLGAMALNIDWARLWHEHRLSVDRLDLRDGSLVVPIQTAGTEPDSFVLENVRATLRFQTDFTWQIDELHAQFMGASFQIAAVVTNAHRLWRPALGPAPVAGPDTNYWRSQLGDFVRVCRQLHFVSPPEFRLQLRGDVRDPESFFAELRCDARGATSPWIHLDDLRLRARLNEPPSTTNRHALSLDVTAAGARSSWGDFHQATLRALLQQDRADPWPIVADWRLTADEVRGGLASSRQVDVDAHSRRLGPDPWQWETGFSLNAERIQTTLAQASSARLQATAIHRLNLPWPDRLVATAKVDRVSTRWAQVGDAQIIAQLEQVPSAITNASPSWGWWTNLVPFAGRLQLDAHRIESAPLAIDELKLGLHWSVPQLEITHLQARLAGGTCDVPEAQLNIDSREVALSTRLDFDVHQVAPLFGPKAARWLDQFSWSHPPLASATARAVLPPWTLEPDRWGPAIRPTLDLQAQIEGESVSFRGVPMDRARVHIGIQNDVLQLRDLHLDRPEGDADLAYDLNLASREFRWHLRACVDAKQVAPVIDDDAPRIVAPFEFTQPTRAEGEVWGRWGPHRWLALALQGSVHRFTFRGEPVDSLEACVGLHDNILTATNASLHVAEEWARAPQVRFDLKGGWLDLTAIEARIDPMRVARAVGSNLIDTLSPYRFDFPVHGRVDGGLPTRGDTREADMRFILHGGPFHYWRFNVPEIEGTVHWQGQHIHITDLVSTNFYDGQITGSVNVHTLENRTADFGFSVTYTNVNLMSLFRDTVTSTNRIEGRAAGQLDITRAHSADWHSWDGFGRVTMRDGLLWDIPVFSLLSPVLNTVVPGLGNSRARAATATFVIDDSVIQTEDLEIQAGPAYLLYKGTLDFDWNIRARVQAEIMAGTPLLGPIFSLVLSPVTKALMFRVSGTLGKPTLEPLYVPKFLTPFFTPFLNPVGTLRKIFAAPATNAPPDMPPPGPTP